MKLKKLISLGMTALLAFSTISCGSTATSPALPNDPSVKETATAESTAESETKNLVEEIAFDDVSVTWEDSRVYKDLTLGRYRTIPTYGVKGYDDVPFIRLTDYTGIIFADQEVITVGEEYTNIYINGTNIRVYPFEDTVWFENAAKVRFNGPIDGGVVENYEFDFITISTKNESVQTEVKPMTIDLKDYHMPVIAYEDDILMPFLALQNTIGAAAWNTTLAYNGKDYYNAFELDEFLVKELSETGSEGGKELPYYKGLMSGPFSKKTKTTQAYADYGYYAVCLLLDLTFGHKEEMGIRTFDEYFTKFNAKKSLTSTDPSAAILAEIMLFNYLFGTGHDSLMSAETVFAPSNKSVQTLANEVADDMQDSEVGQQIFNEQEQKDPAQAAADMGVVLGALMERGLNLPDFFPMLVWSSYFRTIKPEDYGDERLDYTGDTAVIYFNSFKNDHKRDPSFYVDPINDEDIKDSNFAFFYRCFEDIKKHDEVKNVVINLADNGGGNSSGLISILGFLSEDGEVRFTNKDLFVNNYREECYHIDTNLDGVADDNDGYGGQYDFYILCSSLSYSCANALPYYAQKQGLAKILGMAPGGGDCVVAGFIDAYGRCAYYSGFLKLGMETENGFVSDEKATTPDLVMMKSVIDRGHVPWFDPEGIADAVHQYQNGATEISYEGTAQEEQVSDFLSGLLDRIIESLNTNGGNSN